MLSFRLFRLKIKHPNMEYLYMEYLSKNKYKSLRQTKVDKIILEKNIFTTAFTKTKNSDSTFSEWNSIPDIILLWTSRLRSMWRNHYHEHIKPTNLELVFSIWIFTLFTYLSKDSFQFLPIIKFVSGFSIVLKYL